MIPNNNILNLGLAADRHEMPQCTDGFIFSQWLPHADNMVAMTSEKSYKKILKMCKEKGYLDENGKPKDVHINLYVTGLTVALISVLNVTRNLDVTIALWHWDKYKREFYRQDVVK